MITGRWAAAVLAAWLFQTLPAWAGGGISGLVRYQGEVPPLKRSAVTVDAAVCGAEAVDEDFVLGKRGGLKNAVVYLQGRVDGARPYPEPEGGFALDQKNCRFEPRVLVVAAGSRVSVFNSDRLNHHLKALGRTNPPVSMAQPKSVSRMAFRFDYPEILPLRCSVHEWKKSWIVVAEHPYYAVTDSSGRFEIRDIPAGDYTLALWHESLGSETRRIQIREGETLPLDWSATRRLTGQGFPNDPFLVRNFSRLDVNILPVRLVK